MGLGDFFYNVSSTPAAGSRRWRHPPAATLLLPVLTACACPLQTFVRRNSVYVATIIVGAFAGEKVRHRRWRRGRWRRERWPHRGRKGHCARWLVAAVLTIEHILSLIPAAACAQRWRRIVGV